MLQHESEFPCGKCAASNGHRSRKLSRHHMEDDGTAAKMKNYHKHIVILMHNWTCTCSLSGGPRGEVTWCAATGKARPRGLLAIPSRLRLLSSPALTSTPPRQNAARTRLHVVQRHIHVRGREHLRPRLLPRWPDQSRRNSLPAHHH